MTMFGLAVLDVPPTVTSSSLVTTFDWTRLVNTSCSVRKCSSMFQPRDWATRLALTMLTFSSLIGLHQPANDGRLQRA